MTPILKKSKEAARILREKGGRVPAAYKGPSRTGAARGRGANNHVSARGRKKLFLTSRSKLNSVASHASYKRSSSESFLNRDRSGHHYDRYSSTAAAEAYVADYMRTMQHQLPPMPYAPPPGYASLLPSPYEIPARYFDGIPEYPHHGDHIPTPPIGRAAPSYDKRSYDRSVEEFLWKTTVRPSMVSAPSKTSSSYHHLSAREYHQSRGQGHERNNDRDQRSRGGGGRERDYRDRSRSSYRNSRR